MNILNRLMPSRDRYKVVDNDGKTLATKASLKDAQGWILEKGDTENHFVMDSKTSQSWFFDGDQWSKEG